MDPTTSLTSPSTSLASKIAHWLHLKETSGLSFHGRLLQTSDLYDPLCAQHLLSFIDIDPMGTNFNGFLDDQGNPVLPLLDEQQIEGWNYVALANRQRLDWEHAQHQYSQYSQNSSSSRKRQS